MEDSRSKVAPSDVLLACRKHAEQWVPLIESVPYRPSAILPSEMLAFCSMAESLGIEYVIESGRKFGYSTRVLALGPWRVASIEQQPVEESDAEIQGVTLLRADGRKAVAKLVEASKQRTAVLLDGPKGKPAIELLATLDVPLKGLHDVRYKRDLPGWWFADEPLFLEEFGRIDQTAFQFRHSGRADHSIGIWHGA